MEDHVNNLLRRAPSNNGSTTNTRTRTGAGSRTNTNNRRGHHQRSSSNSYDFSWKRQLAMATLSIVLWGIWYGTPLSDVVLEQVLEHVPLQADKELEEAALQQVQVSTYYDSYWTDLIQEIGNDLVRTLEKSCQRRREPDESEALLCQFSQRRNWNFGLVDEPRVVNAFCFPAGTIRITTGLLHRLLPTRGELAALIGHEMGHVLRRHASKRLLSQNLMQKLWDTLLYEDNDGYDETWGEALGELLLKSATWLGQQRFSRRDEYQADAVSWALLQKSTIYGPMAMIRLLEKLHSLQGSATRQASSSTWTTALEDWSSTHPATEDRIQALRVAWAGLPVHMRMKYEVRAYPY
eukprot:scaffold2778_cov168-Amphora_coffeaeformis.AAC.2